MEKGLVIRGEIGRIVAREKAGAHTEIGELLIAKTTTRNKASHEQTSDAKILMQVVDLIYSSQLSEQNIELISGLQLEQKIQEDSMLEPELRNYRLAILKGLVTIQENKTRACKTLPTFLSPIRDIEEDDVQFLTKPAKPLYFGKLRSGSKVLPVDIFLPGDEVFSHHMLIAATTGKGKSNLTSVMLWDATKRDYCGILVLDPHDEYFAQNKKSLKDHPQKENVSYYTPQNPPAGAKTLKINTELLRPRHFAGVVHWSDAQRQALQAYYKEYNKEWIETIIANMPLKHVQFNEGTIAVIRRRLMNLLEISWNGTSATYHGIFDKNAGITTIIDITNELESAKTVIVDTSQCKGATELLIGSMISAEILRRYQQYKRANLLGQKPVISIVIEEAPRVIGKEALEKGSNVFGTIAREGRKFKVGLCAITQLPSVIPREILANMNTKIILGVEMASERQAIIESAAQDLSKDNRNIASLDKGEALITSNFARFATPIKIPFFPEFIKEDEEQQTALNFDGINLS